MHICRFLLASILFKYGLLVIDEDYANRERSGSHIEETTVPSFQKDVRFCRNILASYPPTFDPKSGSYEIRQEHRIPMRITGLKLLDYKKHKHFPRYHTAFYDVSINYTMHRYTDRWITYKDTKNRVRKLCISHIEPEENGGLQMFRIEPNIIAHKLKVQKIHSLITNEIYDEVMFKLLGCLDEQGTKDLQYVDENLLPETEKHWADKLQPDYEDGCAVYDFEQGIVNWTRIGEAFANQPTYGDNKYNRENKNLTRFVGRWWISSYENHPNDTAPIATMNLKNRGALQSPKFVVTTSKYSFLIGGGDTTGSIGMQVIVFGKVVFKFFLKEYVDVMQRQEIDLSQYLKKPAILKLVDESMEGYLMFDDFRTVGRCNDVCSSALGMESGYIKDDMISSSTKHKDANFAEKYSRLSSSFTESKIFKSTAHNWLQIQLPFPSIIDGWATQGYSPDNGVTECSLEKYNVTYSIDNNAWRYISVRDKDNYYIPVEYSHKKGIVNRKWLNPRITAKYIQFMFGSTPKDEPVICFRVELYGCEKFRYKDDKLVADERFKTFIEKQEETKETYELKLLNIPKKYTDTAKPIKLSCASDHTLLALATAFEWYEVFYVSKVVLSEKSDSLTLEVKKSFKKRTIGCQIYRGSDKLFNREFLLIEKAMNRIVPFVTQEAGLEYRGGRLIYSDPAVLYYEGGNTFFFSIHLANLVHPYPTFMSKRRLCPQKDVYHTPFKGFEFYGGYDELLQCFDVALANGSRTFFYQHPYNCYGGEGVQGWSEGKKWGVPFSKYGRHCESIEINFESIGTVSSRSGVDDGFYKIGYKSDFPKIRFYFHLNDEMVYLRRFPINIRMENNAVSYQSTIFETVETDESLPFSSKRPYYYPGVEYISDKKYVNSLYEAPCISYFSPYASKPWGSGHMLTFVYACRNQNIYKKTPYIVMKWFYHSVHSDREKWLETRIALRNVGEPIIILNKEIGVCGGEYQEIKPRIQMNDVMFTAKKSIRYIWRKVTEETPFEKETFAKIATKIVNQKLMYRRKETLVFYKAKHFHSGVYEFIVISPFGTSKLRTRITIYEDFPRITWVTPSPHEVIEGKTDILGIHLSTNENVKEIIWTKNGIRIQESKHYSFIDDNGEAYTRKRILFKNLKSNLLSGRYDIQLVGEYCVFNTSIDVVVLERPSLTLIPHTGRNNFLSISKDSTQILTAIVRGGYPPVQLSDMKWTKNGARIVAGVKGRITVMTSETETNTWRSVLTIKNMNGGDQGEYAITIKSRSDTITKSKVIYMKSVKQKIKGGSKKTTNVISKNQSKKLSIDNPLKIFLSGLILLTTLANITCWVCV